MAKINRRQQLFAEEYLKDLNATRAALAAGYSKKSAGVIGGQLIQKPAIKALIDEAMQARIKRTNITQDFALKRIAWLADSNIKNVASWDDHGLTITDSKDITRGRAYGVDSLEVTETTDEDGEVTIRHKIKMRSPSPALELLARHLGLLSDDATRQSDAQKQSRQILDEALKELDLEDKLSKP